MSINYKPQRFEILLSSKHFKCIKDSSCPIAILEILVHFANNFINYWL